MPPTHTSHKRAQLLRALDAHQRAAARFELAFARCSCRPLSRHPECQASEDALHRVWGEIDSIMERLCQVGLACAQCDEIGDTRHGMCPRCAAMHCSACGQRLIADEDGFCAMCADMEQCYE